MHKDEDIRERRQRRQRQTAEVFTPPELVEQILSKLPQEVWKEGKTFCDPACGNGNFLIAVLRRKIKRGHKSLDALKCVFGVDIKKDNIHECRVRLLKEVSLHEEITGEHVKAVMVNVVYLSSTKKPKGSLQYHFGFHSSGINQRNVREWLENIKKGLFNEEHLPVESDKSDPSMNIDICPPS